MAIPCDCIILDADSACEAKAIAHKHISNQSSILTNRLTQPPHLQQSDRGYKNLKEYCKNAAYGDSR